MSNTDLVVTRILQVCRAAMAALGVSFVVFISLITEVLGWRCAVYRNLFDQQPEYLECLVGCCGNAWNRHCCSEAGLIVGVCLAAVAILVITVIIVLCLRKRRMRQREEYFRTRYPHAGLNITQPAYMPPGKDRRY